EIEDFFLRGNFTDEVAGDPVVEEESGIKVIRKIYFESEALFTDFQVLRGFTELLILILTSRFALPCSQDDSCRRNLGDFCYNQLAVFHPFGVDIFCHGMPAAVFSHIEPFLVLFNTKWELGKIVIIDPVAAYTLFTGQPADMAVNLG